jgi:hypothetical protein
MNITLGTGFLFILIPFLCSLPLVLISVIVLYKFKVLDIEIDKQQNNSMHKDELSIDKSDKLILPVSAYKKNKLPITGCGFLMVSLLCLLALPINFILTLAAAMSEGDFGEFVPYIILIGFYLNIIIIMSAGLIGAILLTFWVIKKNRRSTNV